MGDGCGGIAASTVPEVEAYTSSVCVDDRLSSDEGNSQDETDRQVLYSRIVTAPASLSCRYRLD